jgi:hypothetical protein
MTSPEATCGENKDNANIDLEKPQRDLMDAIFKLNKPVVSIIIDGRPLAARTVCEKSGVVLYAWLPAQEGGAAIAGVLSGKRNPGGKLPVTIVKDAGQIPMYYSRLPVYADIDTRAEYIDSAENTPLYPFGHGLSYTDFSYSDLRLPPEAASDGKIVLSFSVKNTGAVPGDEVAQVYIRDCESSVARPVKQLAGFAKLRLNPGETKTVTIEFDMKQFAFHDINMEQVVEPGKMEVYIGSSSEDIRLKGGFEITGKKLAVERKVFFSTVTVKEGDKILIEKADMKKLICNPLNLEYRYQIKKSPSGSSVFRETAYPTVLLFRDRYLLFASMSAGFWYSDDLYSWRYKAAPELPVYDYAPDVREIGGAVIFSASRRGSNCTFYRSEDPLSKPFEPVSTPFAFWDPDIFHDDDGRVYFYWGCSNREPIWGVEMDPAALLPIGKKTALVHENEAGHGWERRGENNRYEKLKTFGGKLLELLTGKKPFIEGAFMTKYRGKYYLQYATPGTEYNIYGDGVYTGDKPLGPFVYQNHNPFSLKPGGFITSARHGSTFQDKYGSWWHISTMRISINDNFERRIGLFPCGFNSDGVMYCNQNFADYPFFLPAGENKNLNVTESPFMLLSWQKAASASSYQEGYGPENGVDENIRTLWAAASAGDNEWFALDLGNVSQVNAVQINFADHHLPEPDLSKKEMRKEFLAYRLIKTETQRTCFLLEGSADGKNWITIKDRRGGETYAHDFIVPAEPLSPRYLKVSHISLPFGGVPALSGLRVFGRGSGPLPAQVETINVQRLGDTNVFLSWPKAANAWGYNIRYGIESGKLYSSWQLYGKTELDVSTINNGQCYYAAVDSFNENGVTPGKVVRIIETEPKITSN